MKKCPFCAEEIQDEAIKCRYCGENLENKPKEKWFFKTSLIILAFLTVGPLALPLVWFHPRYTLLKKMVISLVLIIISYFLYQASLDAVQRMKGVMHQYEELL